MPKLPAHGSYRHDTGPRMTPPKSAKGSSRSANAGGIRSQIEAGTTKRGGFKGGSKGSGSKGKVGPGTGFQGTHPKGTRRAQGVPDPKPISRMGFTEPR